MNVISWDAAYCMYPRASLEDRIALLAHRSGRKTTSRAYQKYQDRGFTMIKSFAKGDRAFPTKSRWIDDEHSWVIQLPDVDWTGPTTALSVSMSKDPVAATNWRLLRPSEPFITFFIFRGYDLRYDFVLTDLEFMLHIRETMWRPLLAEFKNWQEVTSTSGPVKLTPEERYIKRRWCAA
jgi:hypothetical protein